MCFPETGLDFSQKSVKSLRNNTPEISDGPCIAVAGEHCEDSLKKFVTLFGTDALMPVQINV